MASRRMFSKDVVCSDRFLDMPASAQALYFQYGLEADDDGFVSAPKKILRLTNASDDDLKILVGILAELFIIMCLLAVIWQQICEKKGGTDEQN